MKELFDLVKKLRDRIERYGDLLRGNEALTRYVLIDPVLRALGWDTENPDIVIPEERHEGGRPDYVLYHNGKKLIAIEAKSLDTRFDEKEVVDRGFRYCYRVGEIQYFIITDGNIWKVYKVYEPQPSKRLILEINIRKDRVEDIVRKLLSLWRPLIRYEIEEVKPIIEGKKEVEKVIEKQAKPMLDLNKVREFYNSLTNNGKEFLKIVFEAWKRGRILRKNDIINELRRRGIHVDERGFTGIKSGITRLSEKMNLPPPIPTEKELGEEYWRDETKRYILKDEWGKALENIIK